MKRLWTFAVTVLIAGTTASLWAAPHGGHSHIKSAGSSVGRSLQQSVRSSPSARMNAPKVGNFKPQSNVGAVMKQGQIQSRIGQGHKLTPSIKTNPAISPLVKKLPIQVGPKITPIVGIGPKSPPIGIGPKPKFPPIVGTGPIKPLPPICPPPHHHHDHHHNFPWYLGYAGIGLNNYGYGGGGYVRQTVVCEPVILQVPAPVAPPAAPVEGQPVETPVGTTPATNDEATTEVAKLKQVQVGGSVQLVGQNFGTDLGGVSLKINGVEIGCVVDEWKEDGVKATLPVVGLTGPTKAELAIVLRDGTVEQVIPVELVTGETLAQK